MTPYQILVDVLDRLRAEAPAEYKSYHDSTNEDAVNAARSKAFLHLFLKAKFGLLTFKEREPLITEGADDGGIDAYHIDADHKIIHFLQAKFRTNEKNFEGKTIEPEELLMMDISRILAGETTSEAGLKYNSKILAMIRRIKEIKDIGRYQYRVVILANAKGITRQKLGDLTGGFPCELIDYKSCYGSLMFPLISGTYYNADQLQLSLSLSNKSAGAKISYTVTTEFTKCEITVIFVPTIEIAKTMFKYRNSILQFNPRSYLGHEGRGVNSEIRKSIETRRTNEFALFNNGITILSDETYLNERIGQKDRAQLVLVNPQIINGGQTAYTLSIIYRENIEKSPEAVFGEKEVLVKIITFESSEGLSDEKKLSLIDDISRATNQQSTVTIADRRANERAVIELQRKLFDIAGVFMERKRGEFEDGLKEGYIRESEIIDRTLLFRAAFTIQGMINDALRRKLVAKADYSQLLGVSDDVLEKYAFAVLLLKRVLYQHRKNPRPIVAAILCRVFFGTFRWFVPGAPLQARDESIKDAAANLEGEWRRFIEFIEPAALRTHFTLKKRKAAPELEKYLRSEDFAVDLATYASNYSLPSREEANGNS